MLNACLTTIDLMFFNRAILRQAPITAASKIILNSWKLPGFRLVEPTRAYSSERMSVIRDALAFGGLMWPMSSGAIWIAGIYILALHALNVKIVVMNICWRFLVKEDIFAHLATRNGWWNSANGCAKKYWNTCPIGNGCSVFQSGCESILWWTAN